MLDYSDKCFIFDLNLFDCHLLFTNASKFEGDCKYVQLWIFTHFSDSTDLLFDSSKQISEVTGIS